MYIMDWLRGAMGGAGPIGLDELGVVKLESEGELRECLDATVDAPIFLFKHSTTCPVSAAAYRRVCEYLSERDSGPSFYLVNVIESRAVSNAIAKSLDLRHQSPQLILVENRKSVWSRTHGAIHAKSISRAVAVS